MDTQTLLAAFEFGRARLLGSIAAAEKAGQDLNQFLAWRPGPGRAHCAWQFMHCAATLDRYIHVGVLGGKPKDESLVASFAGGTTPSDQNIPDIAVIRQKLETSATDFKNFVSGLTKDDLLMKKGQPGKERTIGESIVLLIWHEAHHQGQIHLTWNLYKAAHGIT